MAWLWSVRKVLMSRQSPPLAMATLPMRADVSMQAMRGGAFMAAFYALRAVAFEEASEGDRAVAPRLAVGPFDSALVKG